MKFRLRLPAHQTPLTQHGLGGTETIEIVADRMAVSEGLLVFYNGERMRERVIAAFAPGQWLRIEEIKNAD